MRVIGNTVSASHVHSLIPELIAEPVGAVISSRQELSTDCQGWQRAVFASGLHPLA